MWNNTCRTFSLVILFIALGGCSSLLIHVNPDNDWGHPYAGTEKAARGLPCGLAMSIMGLFLPVPFMLADVPLSFVVDTLLLPADIVMTPRRVREDVAVGNQYC
jgi:uncharacterized protein YceK